MLFVSSMEINDTKRNELEIIEKLNEDEVITLIPMILFLSIIGIIGLPGNGLVCYIYSTKYRMSSSRWFIFFLASADLVMCVVIVPSEIGTSLYQYNFTNGAACKITAYLNLWTMLTLGFTLVIVSVDRYRKVCKPLGWQIDFKKARFLSICGIIIGFLIALPVLGVYGIHRYELKDFNVTVSECSFKQTSEGSSFAFYFILFGMVLFICALTTICVLYCFIGKDIKHHIHKEQARRQVSLSASMAHRDIIRTSVSPRDVIVSMNHTDMLRNIRPTKRTVTQFDTQFDSQPQSCRNSNGIDLSNELDDQYSTNNLSDGDTYDFEITPPPTKPLERKKTKRIRRARARKATSSMFLISLAFVLSYLPMLLLLMVRSIDHEFEATLTDAGRAAYKFFLRSYLLNVSINPFIYGLSDTRFRENCKDVLKKIYFTLKCKSESFMV